MIVSFELNDLLSADQQRQLKAILKSTDAQFSQDVAALTKTALAEFTDVILGQYTPRTNGDVNERRVLHLIPHRYAGTMPDEDDIKRLLRITDASATTVLRNLTARQSEALTAIYKRTLQPLFDAKTPNVDGAHHVTITSKHLADWLKDQGSRVAPVLGSIFKVRGANDRYGIPLDTYNAICNDLGLNP